MTWLQGNSTWANICDDIVKLACGEVADGAAVTCAVGDRWVREIGGQNLMRTHASTDVNTGTVHQRAGYFSLLSYRSTTSPNAYGWRQSVCKQTAVWSGTPTGVTNGRWQLFVRVEAANTVPGTYSTATVRWVVYDGDTNNAITGVTLATLSAAGDLTITAGTKTMTFRCTDPSGTLIVNTVWHRAFSTTYLGGIDSFGPMYPRRTANPTFTVNPPGVVVTDYDVNVDVSGPLCAGNTTVTSLFASGTNGTLYTPPGAWAGVGIKTVTALTGAQYACSWPMAFMKIRPIPASGASNGQIDLEWAGGLVNDGGTFRRVGGYKDLAWIRPFTVPGSVNPTSVLQYWLSVKANKIIIVLNGDPGDSGTLTNGGVWPFTPFDYLAGTYDKFPVVVSKIATTNVGTNYHVQQHMTYMHQVWRQDGSEARDWQDFWMRSDHIYSDGGGAGNGVPLNDQIGIFSTFTSNARGTVYLVEGLIDASSNTFGYGAASAPFISSKPNAITGKWRMYGFPIMDRPWVAAGVQSGANPGTAFEDDVPRGVVAGSINSPFLYLPGGLWASGDENTDIVSGKKQFLVVQATGNYSGLLGTMPSGAGVAVLEE